MKNPTESTEPQSRAVAWRDLVALSPLEKARELLLSFPWLLGSLACYQCGWWCLGLACSFYFFLTGLRQSHGAQHYSLGLSRRGHDFVLFGLSGLMLASMHAVQVTHLHHHRHCLDEQDAEGATARLSWWRALIAGPVFAFRLHCAAWQLGGRGRKRWMAVELGLVSAIVFGALFGSSALAFKWHVAAMIAAECLTGFFAVWTVHHDCQARDAGRTQRGRWLNLISFNMFLHAEHHLFPAVPTAHLAELGQRLDVSAPEIRERQVIQVNQKPSIAIR
jgi:fatty acid desaturase